MTELASLIYQVIVYSNVRLHTAERRPAKLGHVDKVWGLVRGTDRVST